MRQNILALLFYIALLLIFFYKAVFGGYVFGIGDFTGSDLLDLHLPFKYILADSYRQHQFPLWTENLANGFPLLAEGQSGALYPPNVLFALLLSPYLALNYSVLLALLLAGFGAYLFARKIFPKLPFGAALFAGMVFMLSSFYIARLKHLNMIVVGAYLPWALYCVRSYFLTERMQWFVGLGLIWALQLLAGHPHMFYLTGIMVVWYVMVEMGYLLLGSRKSGLKGAFSLIKKAIFGLLLATVIGLGLAAPQILATAELAMRSSRVEGTFISSIAHPLDPKFILTFVAPYLFGNPADGSYSLDIVKEGIWWENVLYIGILPIFMVIMFVVIKMRAFTKRHQGEQLIDACMQAFARLSYERYLVCALFGGALLFLYWAMGRYSILYMISYYGLPGMSLFRFPTRFNLFTLLALAVLSGYALDWACRRVALIKNYKKLFIVLVFSFTLVDLYIFSARYIGYFAVADYLKDYSEMAEQYSHTRIYPMTQYVAGPYAEKGWLATGQSIFALQQAFPGNFPAVYGLQSFTDRGWFEGGLSIKERNNLERTVIESGVAGYGKLLGLWNVGTVLSLRQIDDPALVLKKVVPLSDFFDEPLRVYTNTQVFPRAYFSRGLTFAVDQNDFVHEATASGYSPYREVFTANREDVRAPEEAAGVSTVDIVHSDSNIVSLRVRAAQSGYVVLSDTYYPGWEVYLDGLKKKTLQVNLIQRAVMVDAGAHVVEWKYEPKMFMMGMYVSIVVGSGLVLSSVYWLIGRRKVI